MQRGIRRVAGLLVFVLPLAGCLDWLDIADELGPKPPSGTPEPGPAEGPSGTAPLTALCGLDSFAEVLAAACAQERGICEQLAQCASVATPFEDCVVERESVCAQRAQFALESGACFLPQLA